jgi:hypothetical protein
MNRKILGREELDFPFSTSIFNALAAYSAKRAETLNRPIDTCGAGRQSFLVDAASDTPPIRLLFILSWPLKESIFAMNITANSLAFERRLYLKIVSFGTHYLYARRRLQGGYDFGVGPGATPHK